MDNSRFRFRAWHNSMMIYNVFVGGFEETRPSAFNGESWVNLELLDDEKIMQSTGLHDKNGKLIFEGKCKSDAVDFKALLKEMKEAGPDVVFVPAYAKQSGFLVRQAAAMGVKTVFLSGDGWSQIIKYAGDAVNGNYHSTHWHPDVPIPASVAFCQAYKKKYAEEIPSQAAAVVYDAFMVLADAIRRADSSDPAKIRDALAATQNFQGITGKIQFDKNGDPIDKSIIIIKFENGKAIYDKAIQP